MTPHMIALALLKSGRIILGSFDYSMSVTLSKIMEEKERGFKYHYDQPTLQRQFPLFLLCKYLMGAHDD